MPHGELVASPRIAGQGTGFRHRNLKIITDTLPSFTDQQSSESARENMSRLDPFADPVYLYDGSDMMSGTTTPYIFTPARVLISNDMRFRFFPPDQTILPSKPINSIGHNTHMPAASAKVIPFIPEETPALALEEFPVLPHPRPLQPEMVGAYERSLSAFQKSPHQGGESYREQRRDTLKVQTQPIECKKPSAPKGENIGRDDLRRMIRTLSKTERDALMQLLSQEFPSEEKSTTGIRVGTQVDFLFDSRSGRAVEVRGNNMPNMVNDVSTQNVGCASDFVDSLANSDVGGGSIYVQDPHQRQKYAQSVQDNSSTSEQASHSMSPSFNCPHPHYSRTWPNMHTMGGNYAVQDSPIIVDTDTNYTVQNAPKIYMNESASHFAPHSSAQYKFSCIGLASSTFDRRRPRPAFRATIYEDSPKAPKAFTEQDDNIILAAIFYYVGDYNTTDLNWHIIYYYYSLLIYNNRTLSSLRSRFHKYLKMDFRFDIKDYSFSYWLDTLELCVSTMQHANVPITKRGELCNMIATKKNKVHYLVACIFVFLRPDMHYNELKRNFCIWLELINGPHRFI
ncbi:Hypothetical protein GLP15_4711 [Giardia lamblia P15]|uniref:Uncharacterized protein n=1 Tax=Giardia intestinalis (strain P15) TaxID=658858 RepID=E1F1P7_GIAIA|nr:Hypothetical protein GLP15_4711 [Giardia lamblia P15]